MCTYSTVCLESRSKSQKMRNWGLVAHWNFRAIRRPKHSHSVKIGWIFNGIRRRLHSHILEFHTRLKLSICILFCPSNCISFIATLLKLPLFGCCMISNISWVRISAAFWPLLNLWRCVRSIYNSFLNFVSKSHWEVRVFKNNTLQLVQSLRQYWNPSSQLRRLSAIPIT